MILLKKCFCFFCFSDWYFVFLKKVLSTFSRSEKFRILYSCVQYFESEFIRYKKGCQLNIQKHEILNKICMRPWIRSYQLFLDFCPRRAFLAAPGSSWQLEYNTCGVYAVAPPERTQNKRWANTWRRLWRRGGRTHRLIWPFAQLRLMCPRPPPCEDHKNGPIRLVTGSKRRMPML